MLVEWIKIKRVVSVSSDILDDTIGTGGRKPSWHLSVKGKEPEFHPCLHRKWWCGTAARSNPVALPASWACSAVTELT